MVLQTIDQAPIEPFVVQQADVDLFDSLGDFDSFVPTVPAPRRNSKTMRQAQHAMASFSTLPEESVDVEGLDHLSASPSGECVLSVSSRRGSRRGSICSTTSSNSSVCSKSFGFNDGDESITSYGDDAASTFSSVSRSSRRKSKRSVKVLSSKAKHVPVKHVSFTPQVTVRPIPDLEDFSSEERSQVWYNEMELRAIKEEAQELIQKAKRREIAHTAPELRGLHMTQKKQRRSLWLMALTCVLDEQSRQIRNGIPKDKGAESLAKLYKSFAFSAVQIAQKIGHDDAEAATCL